MLLIRIIIQFFLVILWEPDQVFTFIIFYTSLYNLALFLFFIGLTQSNTVSTTTTFYLYTFPNEALLKDYVVVALLSMAGVPPFSGFFSKLAIFVLLLNSSIFFLFPLLFILLFTGLYFYLQNLRLVLTISNRLLSNPFYPTWLQTKFPTSLFFIAQLITISLIGGFFYLEDFLLYSSWILN